MMHRFRRRDVIGAIMALLVALGVVAKSQQGALTDIFCQIVSCV